MPKRPPSFEAGQDLWETVFAERFGAESPSEPRVDPRPFWHVPVQRGKRKFLRQEKTGNPRRPLPTGKRPPPRGGLFIREGGTGAAGPRSGRSPGSPAPGGGVQVLPELGGREGGWFSWNQPYRERKGPGAVIDGRGFFHGTRKWKAAAQRFTPLRKRYLYSAFINGPRTPRKWNAKIILKMM